MYIFHSDHCKLHDWIYLPFLHRQARPVGSAHQHNYGFYRVPTLPGICSKSGKNLEFQLKTWKKNLKFANSVSSFTFQDVIYKNNSDLLLCHIHIINTNTDSKPN